jgi:hypothetical protein
MLSYLEEKQSVRYKQNMIFQVGNLPVAYDYN